MVDGLDYVAVKEAYGKKNPNKAAALAGKLNQSKRKGTKPKKVSDETVKTKIKSAVHRERVGGAF